MRLLRPLQRHLGSKLFLSHLLIVLVGVIVFAGTAELHAPAALDRHVARMRMATGTDPTLVSDVYASFDAAVNEILAVATAAALLAALLVSGFVARRIVGPLRQMIQATHRIAAGDYHQRVGVSGEDELAVLAQDFNQMAATLADTEQRRLELIANVSHELRTPLTGMRTIVDGLMDGVLPSTPDTYARVQREVDRLQRLVDDLRDLSRAEARQIPLQVRSVAPQQLVAAATERLAPQFEDKGVALTVDVPSTLPPVLADPDRLLQVLLNLIGNALQYTAPGGRVTVRAWHEADDVHFAIHDTGVGIAAEHVPHLFERFYRVDKSRARVGGGSGIGLTIAKHLVEAHGGRIWAASPGLGQGSTFTFTLPRAS